MAVYKVWLTVKNSAGNTKEIDVGNINVDLTDLTPDDVSKIEAALPLEDYLKKNEIDLELDAYATDIEVEQATKNTVKYGGFEFTNGENPEEAGN